MRQLLEVAARLVVVHSKELREGEDPSVHGLGLGIIHRLYGST